MRIKKLLARGLSTRRQVLLLGLGSGLGLPAARALAGVEPVRLELLRADIDGVAVEPEFTTVRLTPDAAHKLRLFTREHIGRVLELSIDGLPALKVRVQTEIESGILRLPSPSPALRQRLEGAGPARPTSR